jgi:phage I-like protein
LLKAGEYRYFSPYFDVEITSSGKRWVREIYNFALTNDPATIGQTPLILSRGEKPMKEALFAAIRDLLAATLPPEQAAALAASILELPEIVALVPVEEAPETEAAPEAPAADLPAQMQEALTKLLARTENLEKAVLALNTARQALSGAKPAQAPARKAETPEAVFSRVLLSEKRAGKSEEEARLAAFTAARAVKK